MLPKGMAEVVASLRSLVKVWVASERESIVKLEGGGQWVSIEVIVDRRSPPTSEIEWLFVDVDGYKIVNVYKPPLTRLRTLDLPVFPHPCLYAGDFSCRHADWGYNDNSPDCECLAGWASINCLALLYNIKDAASFYSGRWNTGTNPDLDFASVGPNSRLPDRRVLDKCR